MKQKKHNTEEIIRILRQADGDGTIESICREHNISKATFHRWRRKYGDMDLADAKRLKELERENAELKKMLAESMLKNRVLEEVNAKKMVSPAQKKQAVAYVFGHGFCSERRACRYLGVPRSTFRYPGTIRATAIDESARYWSGRAGRLAANRFSVSGGKRA
jgi:putative transposase